MASFLEVLPSHILQRVAFFSVLGSIFSPPHALLNLLLTCRHVHDILAMNNCPHLYADIFASKFDLDALARRFLSVPHLLTASSLSSELVRRCRLLQRIRQGSIGSQRIEVGLGTADLWTAYFMILESDGLNEFHLNSVGFPYFIFQSTRLHLRRCIPESRHPGDDERSCLMVWLTWLTISHVIPRERTSMEEDMISVAEKDEMLALLRPLAMAVSTYSSMGRTSPSSLISRRTSPPPYDLHSNEPISPRASKGGKAAYFSQDFMLSFPNLSSSSILLTFALKETSQVQRPSHALPANRASALASRRTGPTEESITAINQMRRPWIPRLRLPPLRMPDSQISSRSAMHDLDFCRLFLSKPSELLRHRNTFLPGSLTGIWEGYCMVSPSISPDTTVVDYPDFLSRFPMQCVLNEYICFCPNVPVPSGMGYGAGDDDAPAIWSFEELSHKKTDNILEFYRTKSSPRFRYESYTGLTVSGRNPRDALDVLITGDTQSEFDNAWCPGGLKWTGRVRVRDGYIMMKKEPKDCDRGQGVWIFEGYQHSDNFLVGRWSSSKAVDRSVMKGIFCLRKARDSARDNTI